MNIAKLTSALVIMCALTSCYTNGSTQHANVKSANMHATNTSAGTGYIDACKAALHAPCLMANVEDS